MYLKFLFIFIFSIYTKKHRKLLVTKIQKDKEDLLNRLLFPMPTKNMSVKMKLK